MRGQVQAQRIELRDVLDGEPRRAFEDLTGRLCERDEQQIRDAGLDRAVLTSPDRWGELIANCAEVWLVSKPRDKSPEGIVRVRRSGDDQYVLSSVLFQPKGRTITGDLVTWAIFSVLEQVLDANPQVNFVSANCHGPLDDHLRRLGFTASNPRLAPRQFLLERGKFRSPAQRGR